MADIDIPSYEQLTTLMSHLMTNYTSLALTYYRMFYDMTPQDIEIQLYDTNGNLNTYTIPNRAKDFRYCLNGEGSPEGLVSAEVGSTYQDTKNGVLYIKETGSSDVTGWTIVGSDVGIEKGHGNPEGMLSRPKGTIYEDIDATSIYIKSTETGNTGWVLVSADTSDLANKDLSNLSSTGNNKFANKDLSNLSTAGQDVLDAKEDKSNKATAIDDSNKTNVTQYPAVKAVVDYVATSTADFANKDLSNISYAASLKFDSKANRSLSNIDLEGQARISNLTPYCIANGNLNSNGDLDLLSAQSTSDTTYIFCEARAAAYQVEIATAGTYEIEVVSGGAAGTQWDWYYFDNEVGKYGIKEGSTGAYFKGTVNLSQGTHSITLNPTNGNVTIDNGFTLTGGTFSGEGNTSVANGGRLTVNTIVAATTVYNQGKSTSYHVVNQADPSGVTYGPQEANVPAALKGFGFGGAGGFYTNNEAGGCYLKLTVPGISSTEVRYNVSTENPLIINTVDGLQKSIYGVNNDIITASLADGTYTKFVDENGSELVKCTVYKSLKVPSNPATNDVWVKLTEPLEVYRWNGTSWVEYKKIPIGTVKVTGGTIANVSKDVTEEKLLDNGFDITVYTAPEVPGSMPNYTAGISKAWNTDHTATENGWVRIQGVILGRDVTQWWRFYINGVEVLYEWGGIWDEDIVLTLLAPVSKGDVYKATGSRWTPNLTFYPCKGGN